MSCYFGDSFLIWHGLQHLTPGCSSMDAFITQEWTTLSPPSGSDTPYWATPMCEYLSHPTWVLTSRAKPLLRTDVLSHPAMALPLLQGGPCHSPGLQHPMAGVPCGRTPSIWTQTSHARSSPSPDTCPHQLGSETEPAWSLTPHTCWDSAGMPFSQGPGSDFSLQAALPRTLLHPS